MPKINKVVIVGGVAGGASCAARLRRQSERMEIIVIERGEHVSFANCGLPYHIGEVIPEEKSLLLADPVTFRARFHVDVRVQEEVLSVDRKTKTLTVRRLLDNKIYTETYDNLVLATGASPLRPNIEGIGLPGIFHLKDIPDSRRIKAWLQEHSPRSAVVIGGGFIGLEMVENLHHLGLNVTLIEKQDQLLPVLDREMSCPIQEKLQEQGIEVLLQEAVSRFEEKDGRLEVYTESGRSISTDLVILSIGVQPESQLARDAQLQIGKRGHIVVDSNMRTSDRNIYAVGDVVEVRSAIIDQKTALPLAGPANRQGRIAADVISSHGRFFRGVQGTAICGFFDMVAATTGINEKTLRGTSIDYGVVFAHPKHHVAYYPGAEEIFLKLIYDKLDGRVLGAQAIGTKGVARRIDVIAMAIQMKATVFDLEESELCYAPQFGAAKDPVNIIGMIAANAMRGDLVIIPWKELGKPGSVLLDVRDFEEISENPLPHNTIHIPLDQLRERMDELPKDQQLQVSCEYGARAYNATRVLIQHGFDCGLLSGGAETWFHIQ